MELDLPLLQQPHFVYPPGKAPAKLERLTQDIVQADGYVVCSPEYNHSLSPALANMMNHVAARHFAYKPSAIVTYSIGAG